MSVDLLDSPWPPSIRAINNLESVDKQAIYRSLIPNEILLRFGIAPTGDERLQINCPHDTRSVEIIVCHELKAQDPVLYLQLADTMNFQIALLLLVINDPDAERYNTDIDQHGLPTRFGTMRRNIPEEIRAMSAGLSPGQVRRGLRLSNKYITVLERFVTRTGHEMVIIDPLTYNNAIVYERYGFAYFQGRARMEWIDRMLRPDGDFFNRLDGSSPFRQPDAWRSIRGRSWAIHDGILEEPFGDIRMYKRVGLEAGINTFPDGMW